jgi:hypothetical protein
MTCSGDGEGASSTAWRAGAAFGFSATALKFGLASGGGDTTRADFRKSAVLATLERRIASKWTLSLAAGSTIDGTLRIEGSAHDLSAGPLVALSTSYRAVDEARAAPFVLLTASLGGSLLWTRQRAGDGAATDGPSERMIALDGRVGVIAGKTIADIFSPYLAARAFGLPIFWTYRGQDITGTDAFHYQLAAGFSLRVGKFDVGLEMAPLGERAITAGAGVAF